MAFRVRLELYGCDLLRSETIKMEHTALQGQLYQMEFYFNDHRRPMKVKVDTGSTGTIRGIRKQLCKMMNLDLDEVIICMVDDSNWNGQALDEDVWDPNMEYAGYQIAARQPTVEGEKQSLGVVHFRYEVYSAKGKSIHSEIFGVPLLISLPLKERWGTYEIYHQILIQAQHFLINMPNVKCNRNCIKAHGVFHLDLSWYEQNGFGAINHIDAIWRMDEMKRHWNRPNYDKHASMGVPPGRAWAPTIEREKVEIVKEVVQVAVERVMVEVVKEVVKECVVCMNARADTAFLHKYVSSNG